MKYRRRPVVRDVVDALKDEQNYYYQEWRQDAEGEEAEKGERGRA